MNEYERGQSWRQINQEFIDEFGPAKFVKSESSVIVKWAKDSGRLINHPDITNEQHEEHHFKSMQEDYFDSDIGEK